MVEIISEKQRKVKRMERAEESLRDFWDHIKHTNIQIIGVPEEEERKKGYEKNFEEIIVANFPNMEKEIANQVQEEQRVPYRINPRRNTPRSILIKLTKIKHKEIILKSSGQKMMPFEYPGSAGAGPLQVAPETGISKVNPQPHSPSVQFSGQIGSHLGGCRSPCRIDRARGVGSACRVANGSGTRGCVSVSEYAWHVVGETRACWKSAS